MNHKPSSYPASAWSENWRFTLVLPLLLWCLGFLTSFILGCSVPQALLKATAYALSGLAGWIVYLLTRRPSDIPVAVWAFTASGNTQLLQPTKILWPFPGMLAHGLILSIFAMSLTGLVGRWLEGRKRPALTVAHPLFDDQVDLPLSER